MKPVQVLFDAELLAELDKDDRVQRRGRSSVLREIAAEYLRERRQRLLDEQYESGYGARTVVSDDLTGWDGEGEWPDG